MLTTVSNQKKIYYIEVDYFQYFKIRSKCKCVLDLLFQEVLCEVFTETHWSLKYPISNSFISVLLVNPFKVIIVIIMIIIEG